ncbi:MAG: glutamate synthase subunit beta [Oscillospiraceae bacterium]|nr:glutamate synthase subunit beta [Oscillospiraceae bacterium]
MGKATGFMEFDRKTNPAIEPLERIKNFNEFHPPLDREARQTQGARCMNCGVPFCTAGLNIGGAGFSGCPLHNVIPEWNDILYIGNWEHALARLRKTSNFPEFTGRVCPALCEAGCTCGLNGDPVTVRKNELALIENGYAQGWIKPMIPSTRTGMRVAVVGSGPSGLAVADQLNHRGHLVTVYERDDRIGGLLMYGIPNMKLEKHIIDRRVKLMEEEGVTFVTNVNVGVDIPAQKLIDEYDAVVLCCGAKNPRNLSGPGRDDCKGIYFAVDFLTANTKSLLNSNLTDGKYISAKDKNVVIVGGGDTGNDCIGTSIRHGCKSVTAIEMMPKSPDVRGESNPWPQWPRVAKVDYGHEEAIAVFGHDPRLYQTTVKEYIPDENGNLKAVKIVYLEPQVDPNTGRTNMVEIPGSEEELPCELLLIAAGFLGPQSYVPEAFGLETDARSNVKTAPDHYKTNVEKVFVAGDMHRGQSLVVWGVAEGRACAAEVDEYLMGYTSL